MVSWSFSAVQSNINQQSLQTSYTIQLLHTPTVVPIDCIRKMDNRRGLHKSQVKTSWFPLVVDCSIGHKPSTVISVGPRLFPLLVWFKLWCYKNGVKHNDWQLYPASHCSRKMHGRDLNTVAPLPGHYCTDSGFKRNLPVRWSVVNMKRLRITAWAHLVHSFTKLNSQCKRSLSPTNLMTTQHVEPAQIKFRCVRQCQQCETDPENEG